MKTFRLQITVRRGCSRLVLLHDLLRLVKGGSLAQLAALHLSSHVTLLDRRAHAIKGSLARRRTLRPMDRLNRVLPGPGTDCELGDLKVDRVGACTLAANLQWNDGLDRLIDALYLDVRRHD